MNRKASDKEKFYVFLDFDGVLYDLEYLIMNKIKKNEKLIRFAPDSIGALNTLFDQLSTKYDPQLVISSFWRCKFPMAVNVLKNQGFNIVGVPISKTDISTAPHKRGLEIKGFLDKHDKSENFLIIDDGKFDYAEHFPPEKVIKTSILNDRLTEDKLNTALGYYGLTPTQANHEMSRD